MWSIVITVFLIIFGPVNYYIGRRGWQALGRQVPFLPKWLYWTAFWLLAATFPAAEFGERALPAGLLLILTYAGGCWLAAMVYFFIVLLVIDLVRLTDKVFEFIPGQAKVCSRVHGILGLTVLTLVLSVTVYGVWNARHPVITGYNLTVHKKANGLKQLHIVMVSDFHIGNIVRPARLNPLAEAVNRLQPDLILFAGDMVDQSLDTKEAQELVSVLGGMKARYGKFAVTGNHDRFGRQIDHVSDYLGRSGITILRDTCEKVRGSLYLIGRNNAGMHREQTAQGSGVQASEERPASRPAGNQRRELTELLQGVDNSLPLILLDHQPVDLENAQKNKVDLQLAGHTHRGQVFPVNLVTGQLYETDWGLLTRGAYKLIVSCGYGTWGPPLRIGNHPEIVDINVRFE